jgi:predicted N-acetyltransferase YhbS
MVASDMVDVTIGRINADRHDPTQFSCGLPEVDRWLHDQAAAADQRPGARVYVATSGRQIVGCIQLGAFQVEADPTTSVEAAQRLVPGPIRAILLSQLSVDERWQRRGLASLLLLNALDKVVHVAAHLGTRLIVGHGGVDHGFCDRWGFQAFESRPGWLYLPIKDVAATLACGAVTAAIGDPRRSGPLTVDLPPVGP